MLTRNQQSALTSEGNLAVTANAGAGKTRVLVERFVETLIATGTRLPEIVAITFTEKAAAELRNKISAAVLTRLRSASDRAERERLEHIRDNLASSPIGTIHAFCAKLLREYPVEADVDAGFTVLEGHDRDAMEGESLETTMRSLFDENIPESERGESVELARMLGRRKLESLLVTMSRHRDRAEQILGSALAGNRPDEEVLQAWDDAMTTFVLRRLESAPWKHALTEIIARAEGKKSAEVRALAGGWNGCGNNEERLELYKRISTEVFTKGRGPRVTTFGKKSEEVGASAEFRTLEAFDAEIGKFVRGITDPDAGRAHAALLRCSRILLRLFARFMGNYDTRKGEQGMLDFDDLERKTANLLKNADVREHAASRFRYLMVDEFQDTNQSQFAILRSLLDGFSRGNIFIVGDPKQSIYGFRNADAGIFQRTRTELGERRSEGGEGDIVLPESFRLLSNLVLFINRVFAPLMRKDADESGVRYEELIRGRQNEAPGRVELLIAHGGASSDGEPPEHEESPSGGAGAECDLIARRILALRRDEHPIYRTSDDGEAPSPFRFSDAAILLRSRTHLKSIEHACIIHEIPYLIAGGIGYYQTQEIYDFVNYFKFLLNPNDDVALFGILRSPLFAVSDADLFEISLSTKGVSLWEKLAGAEKKTEEARRAADILSIELRCSHTLPITMLIHRIVRSTGWKGVMSGMARGAQHIANVEKLISVARQFQAQGNVMLYDFVERLQSLIIREEREGQAVFESTRNAVRIMTVHSAKGLEFPVVFLPFTHRDFLRSRPKFADEIILDPVGGLAFRIPDPENYDKELEPPYSEFLRLRLRRKEEEEEKRIFYVACTRARDMLVLSGNDHGKELPPSWLKWVASGLGRESFAPGSMRFEERLRFLEKGATSYAERESLSQLEVIVSSQCDAAGRTTGDDEAERKPGIPGMFLAPLEARSKGEFYSATHIRTYLECPAKYFLKIHLGLPEHHAAPVGFDENEDPNDLLRGEIEGMAAHGVLQSITHSPDVDLNATSREELAAISTLTGKDLDDASAGIADLVTGFLRSPFGAEVMGGKEHKNEYTLNLQFEESFLTGTLDKLWKGATGEWSIVDYKTDRIERSEIERRAALYRSQIEVYAFLVSRNFRQRTVKSSIVFLRHPDAPVSFSFDESDLKKIEQKIRGTISRIQAGDFSRSDEKCSSCRYSEGGDCVLPKDFRLKERNPINALQ